MFALAPRGRRRWLTAQACCKGGKRWPRLNWYSRRPVVTLLSVACSKALVVSLALACVVSCTNQQGWSNSEIQQSIRACQNSAKDVLKQAAGRGDFYAFYFGAKAEKQLASCDCEVRELARQYGRRQFLDIEYRHETESAVARARSVCKKRANVAAGKNALGWGAEEIARAASHCRTRYGDIASNSGYGLDSPKDKQERKEAKAAIPLCDCIARQFSETFFEDEGGSGPFQETALAECQRRAGHGRP
jgi:hypothetical protein